MITAAPPSSSSLSGSICLLQPSLPSLEGNEGNDRLCKDREDNTDDIDVKGDEDDEETCAVLALLVDISSLRAIDGGASIGTEGASVVLQVELLLLQVSKYILYINAKCILAYLSSLASS